MIPAPPLSSFSIGPLTVHLYGISIALALVICYTLALKNAKRRNVPEKEYDRYFFISILCALVGARTYHVLANWGYYKENISEIIAIWNGGIGIYGGIITGTLALYILSRIYSRSFLDIGDLYASVLPLGQAIGRWGNYFNQELFGYPTAVPWALQVDERNRPDELKHIETFHPTFLYESILNIINFIILYSMYTKKKTKPGVIAALYCINYGIIRFIVDTFKIDPDPNSRIGVLSLSQVTSIIVLLFGVTLLIYIKRPLPEK